MDQIARHGILYADEGAMRRAAHRALGPELGPLGADQQSARIAGLRERLSADRAALQVAMNELVGFEGKAAEVARQAQAVTDAAHSRYLEATERQRAGETALAQERAPLAALVDALKRAVRSVETGDDTTAIIDWSVPAGVTLPARYTIQTGQGNPVSTPRITEGAGNVADLGRVDVHFG